MAPERAVIDVWLADAASGAWAGQGRGDGSDPDHLSAVGRELSAAVLGGCETSSPNNLSHSGSLVVFAIARSPCVTHLGVDVEMRRDLPRVEAFAGRILAPGEAGALDLVSAWTLKEAALKATGIGLAGDPRSWRLDDFQSANPRLLEAPDAWGPPTHWAFVRTDIEGPAALAVAARLKTAQPVDVVVRSADGPAEAARPGRTSALRFTWWPRYSPTSS